MSTDLERAERTCVLAGTTGAEEVVHVGPVTLLRCPTIPTSPMLNRVVELGVHTPATEAQLDEIAATMTGFRHYVAVSPRATPATLPAWLAARNYQPSWGWMLFTRGVEELALQPSDVTVAAVDRTRAADFARIVAEGYGMPSVIHPLLETICDRPGWQAFVAEARGLPIGAAALFVADRVGYLGFAATLADFRGRGAQSALLAARIRRARELGCDLVTTETGERVPDRPSSSYRNILRAGFRERHVVANYITG